MMFISACLPAFPKAWQRWKGGFLSKWVIKSFCYEQDSFVPGLT